MVSFCWIWQRICLVGMWNTALCYNNSILEEQYGECYLYIYIYIYIKWIWKTGNLKSNHSLTFSATLFRDDAVDNAAPSNSSSEIALEIPESVETESTAAAFEANPFILDDELEDWWMFGGVFEQLWPVDINEKNEQNRLFHTYHKVTPCKRKYINMSHLFGDDSSDDSTFLFLKVVSSPDGGGVMSTTTLSIWVVAVYRLLCTAEDADDINCSGLFSIFIKKISLSRFRK